MAPHRGAQRLDMVDGDERKDETGGGAWGRRWLRAIVLRLWFLVVIGVVPAVTSVGANVLLVRAGVLEGIAPWQLLLGFAILAYLAYGVRDRLPFWKRIADAPAYRRRQLRRHANQLLRVTRRALRRPWYRRRVAPPAVAEIQAALDALSVAVKTRSAEDPDALHAPLDRLEALFDRHLSFMKISVYVEYVGQIALAVVVAFALRESLVEAFKIPSGSMLPTLEVGDHIFVNKLAYGVHFPFTNWIPIEYGEPERGDVIVFREAHKAGDDFIKRVVAVGGDQIRVEDDGTLRINGRTVERCPLGAIDARMSDDRGSPIGRFDLFVESLGGVRYAIRQTHDGRRPAIALSRGPLAYRDAGGGELILSPGVGPVGRPFPRRPANRCPQGSQPGPEGCLVPDGHVFVMGDNRDNSNDSRFWGPVPLDHIKGKAMFIWWSNADRSVETDRIGIAIHDGLQVTGRELTDEMRECLRRLDHLPAGAP